MDAETVTEAPSTPPPATKPKKSNKPAKASAKNAKPLRRGKPARTELKVEDMTPDELKLLRALFSVKGPRESKTLHVLQEQAFGKIKGGGTVRVRNNLRRLVKFGWLEEVEMNEVQRAAAIAANAKAGRQQRAYAEYRLTEKGRKRGLKAN